MSRRWTNAVTAHGLLLGFGRREPRHRGNHDEGGGQCVFQFNYLVYKIALFAGSGEPGFGPPATKKLETQPAVLLSLFVALSHWDHAATPLF